MKNRNYFYQFFFLLLISSAIFTSCQQGKTDKGSSAKISDSSTSAEQQKQLRHVVLFKFKEGTTQEDIARVEEAFAALPVKIPEIVDFEWGTNNSPEGLSRGFTHCFLLTFDSEEARAVYLPHPEHKAFGQTAGQFIDNVLVVDYWN